MERRAGNCQFCSWSESADTKPPSARRNGIFAQISAESYSKITFDPQAIFEMSRRRCQTFPEGSQFSQSGRPKGLPGLLSVNSLEKWLSKINCPKQSYLNPGEI